MYFAGGRAERCINAWQYCPACPDADELVTADGKITAIFATSNINIISTDIFMLKAYNPKLNIPKKFVPN